LAKISFTGKQFTLTVPKDLMEMMGWDKDTEILISKFPNQEILYIEEIKKKRKQQ
jgi:antitoxin component of MazEF toxin-antitoxin module